MASAAFQTGLAFGFYLSQGQVPYTNLLLRQHRKPRWLAQAFEIDVGAEAVASKKAAKVEKVKTVEWSHETKEAIRKNVDGTEDSTKELFAPEGADMDARIWARFPDGTEEAASLVSYGSAVVRPCALASHKIIR